MATVLDLGPGDVTAFGKTLNDIGNSQQQVRNQTNQIANQYDISNKEIAQRQPGIDLANQKTQGELNAIEKMNAGIALYFNGLPKGDSGVPQIPSATLVSPVQPPQAASASPDGSYPTPMSLSPEDVLKNGLPVKNTTGPVPITAPTPATEGVLPEYHNPFFTTPDKPMTRAQALTHGGNTEGINLKEDALQHANNSEDQYFLPATPTEPMTEGQKALADIRRRMLIDRINKGVQGVEPTKEKTALGQTSTAEVGTPSTSISPSELPNPAVLHPVVQQHLINQSQAAAQNPQIQVAQQQVQKDIAKIDQVVSSNPTPAQLMSLSANPVISHMLSGTLPPELNAFLAKEAADPANRHTPIAPIYQNLLEMSIAPLKNVAEQSDLYNKIFMNQYNQQLSTGLINSMSGNGSVKSVSTSSVPIPTDDERAKANSIAMSSKMAGHEISSDQVLNNLVYQRTGMVPWNKDQTEMYRSTIKDLGGDETVKAANENLTALEKLQSELGSKNLTGPDFLAAMDAFAGISNKIGVKIGAGQQSLVEDLRPLRNKISGKIQALMTGNPLTDQDVQNYLATAKKITDAVANRAVNGPISNAKKQLEVEGVQRASQYPLVEDLENYVKSKGSSLSSSSNSPTSSKIVIQNGQRFQATPSGYKYVGKAQ